MLCVCVTSSSLTPKIKIRQCCVCCERFTQRPRPLVSHLITWTHHTHHTQGTTHTCVRYSDYVVNGYCGECRWYQYYKQVDLTHHWRPCLCISQTSKSNGGRYQRCLFGERLGKVTLAIYSRSRMCIITVHVCTCLQKIETNKSSSSRGGSGEWMSALWLYLTHGLCDGVAYRVSSPAYHVTDRWWLLNKASSRYLVLEKRRFPSEKRYCWLLGVYQYLCDVFTLEPLVSVKNHHWKEAF